MGSIIINASLAFVMITTLVFTLGDVENILASPTGYPFIQVFYNATQSYAGTNVMTAIVIIMLTACAVSEVAAASRQIWSFARDAGLPGHRWLSKVRLLTTLIEGLLLIQPGLPRLEHSTPRRHRLARYQRAPLSYQHWL